MDSREFAKRATEGNLVVVPAVKYAVYIIVRCVRSRCTGEHDWLVGPVGQLHTGAARLVCMDDIGIEWVNRTRRVLGRACVPTTHDPRLTP